MTILQDRFSCKYYEDCFSCPFTPDCVVDTLSRTNAELGMKLRRGRIGKLLGEGKLPKEISFELEMPMKMINRDIIEIRKEKGNGADILRRTGSKQGLPKV